MINSPVAEVILWIRLEINFQEWKALYKIIRLLWKLTYNDSWRGERTMLNWFSVFSNVGKPSVLRKPYHIWMSWEVFRGSRRRKGKKYNTSWHIHFLVPKEQQNFLSSLGFCCYLVNINCPVLALDRFWDMSLFQSYAYFA